MKFKIAQQGRFGKKSVLKSWKKSKIEKVVKNGPTRVKKGDIHLLPFEVILKENLSHIKFKSM